MFKWFSANSEKKYTFTQINDTLNLYAHIAGHGPVHDIIVWNADRLKWVQSTRMHIYRIKTYIWHTHALSHTYIKHTYSKPRIRCSRHCRMWLGFEWGISRVVAWKDEWHLELGLTAYGLVVVVPAVDWWLEKKSADVWWTIKYICSTYSTRHSIDSRWMRALHFTRSDNSFAANYVQSTYLPNK